MSPFSFINGLSTRSRIVPGLITLAMAASTAMASDTRFDQLPPDQQKLAQRLDSFIARMDEKYFSRIEQLNGEAEFEQLLQDTEYSEYDIRVTRGPVIEKAGRMLARGKKTSPGRGDGVLVWGRFYSLDIHPKTPLVGMLHATIVLQFFENGDAAVGGWLGVMPGTRIEADLDALRVLTDEHFARHDKRPDLYRRLICKGTQDTVSEFRRQPACVGASFYGPPVYRDDTAMSYQFIEEMFDLFVGGYMDIVTRRAGESFTAEDLAAQDDMRRRWLIDQLFSDPFASKIVPFEIWSLANVPPVIKF